MSETRDPDRSATVSLEEAPAEETPKPTEEATPAEPTCEATPGEATAEATSDEPTGEATPGEPVEPTEAGEAPTTDASVEKPLEQPPKQPDEELPEEPTTSEAAAPAGKPEEPEAPEAAAGAAADSAPEAAAAPAVGATPAAELPPEIVALRKARDKRTAVEGRVFGWNPGGFHVVLDGVPAFCPRSEMEIGEVTDPEAFLDQTLSFRVIRIQGKGRRIVLSRTAVLRQEQQARAAETLKEVKPGSVVTGTVSSLTDFGAFVDLGGVEGMVHVSEIGRQRIAKPEEALSVGQEVRAKVLEVKKGGRRISLSIKALEPDPWGDVKRSFPAGSVVSGRVERIGPPGAFIELAPGLVGLLPTSEMGLPREALPARAFPPGKEVRVMVMSVDPRRRRIALALEGAAVGGSRHDFVDYVKQQEREGFGSLADAFRKLKK